MNGTEQDSVVVAVINAMQEINYAAGLYMSPWMVVLGIAGNLVSLVALQSKSITVGSTVRVYYSWIAFFDAMTIGFKDVTFSFLAGGLYYAYNGHPPFNSLWTSYAIWTCRLVVFFYQLAEMCANNGFVALSVERLLVLSLPFQAKRLTGPRKALGGLMLLLCVAILLSAGFPISAQVLGNMGVTVTVCVAGAVPWATRVVTVAFFCVYVLPPLLATVAMLATLVKVRSIAQKTRLLGNAGLKVRERQNVVVIVLMVLVNDLILVPVGTCFAVLTVGQVVAPENTLLSQLSNAVFLGLYPFPILSHSANFLIYWSNVPGFKESVISLFKCRRISKADFSPN